MALVSVASVMLPLQTHSWPARVRSSLEICEQTFVTVRSLFSEWLSDLKLRRSKAERHHCSMLATMGRGAASTRKP